MPTSDLEDLANLHRRIVSLPEQQAALIATCRRNGRTWPEIAGALDMTVHGAIKASKPSGNRPGRPKVEGD